MEQMGPAKARLLAKELTIIAMQAGLISKSSEADDTAQAVLNFYRTIRDGLIGEED